MADIESCAQRRWSGLIFRLRNSYPVISLSPLFEAQVRVQFAMSAADSLFDIRNQLRRTSLNREALVFELGQVKNLNIDQLNAYYALPPSEVMTSLKAARICNHS